MILQLFTFFAQVFSNIWKWFESLLISGGAYLYFISGICAIISTRYLLLPLLRTSINPISRTKHISKDDNK